MYCCFCLTSVVPSNEPCSCLPCCVDRDNHQVSVCLKPDSIASFTVSSSNVLYCLVLATFNARNLPVFNPLCAFSIVFLKKFSFHDSDDTGCGAIEKVKEIYKDKFGNKFHKKIIFCNGGDRTADNVPEQERYKTDKWVSFEFGVGGESKKNSSSWILEDYKNAKTIRNWGYYRVIHEIGKGVKVKELVIEPGKSLSNQYHNKRNELWYVMKGEVVMNGVIQKEHGPAFLIPKEYWHHAKNVSDKPCHVLECQYGEECIEEDIVRQPLNEN